MNSVEFQSEMKSSFILTGVMRKKPCFVHFHLVGQHCCQFPLNKPYWKKKAKISPKSEFSHLSSWEFEMIISTNLKLSKGFMHLRRWGFENNSYQPSSAKAEHFSVCKCTLCMRSSIWFGTGNCATGIRFQSLLICYYCISSWKNKNGSLTFDHGMVILMCKWIRRPNNSVFKKIIEILHVGQGLDIVCISRIVHHIVSPTAIDLYKP